jgi:hypothetical protein
MTPAQTILLKTLVKPYYRQNGGLFIFVYFILIVAVGRANEAGLLEYHYALIRGMLTNPVIFILVLVAWLFFAGKCQQFVERTLRNEEFSFLSLLSLLNAKRVYGLLLQLQFIIFLPVTLYVLVIIGVGFHQHWYGPVMLVIFYISGTCFTSAGWYLYLLQNPGTSRYFLRWRVSSVFPVKYYWSFFLNFIMTKRKLFVLAIKLYSCGTLYLMLLNRSPVDHDLSMVFLFFSFGLLGHGVLIHQFREIEETRLAFYRSLPVSLLGRWVQYAWLYFLLFIPEVITIARLTPKFLHYADAALLFFFGYSLLLFLNSLLFVQFYKMVDYLKMMVGIFFIVYLSVLTGILLWFSVFTFSTSLYLLFAKYYRYER